MPKTVDPVKQHAKLMAEKKREIRREIRAAYEQGRTLPYDLRTLIESGVSMEKCLRVYRKEFRKEGK